MHGSFIVCLKEMIINRFDESFWIESLELAGFEKDYHPVSNQELLDAHAIKLIKSVVKKLNLDERRFGEIFGNYWINYFAKEKYFAFFKSSKNVKEFLQQINAIHKKITANLPNQNAPFFEIIWEKPNTAEIEYKSSRGFIHIAVGLLKALGSYYREDIAVYRIENNKIKLFIKNYIS
jgi:mRNA deadenylase 3'-5' endonuclease subunit Ccr4